MHCLRPNISSPVSSDNNWLWMISQGAFLFTCTCVFLNCFDFGARTFSFSFNNLSAISWKEKIQQVMPQFDCSGNIGVWYSTKLRKCVQCKYRCSHNRLHTNEVSVLKVSLFRVIQVPRFEFGLRVLHADTTRKGYFKKGNSKIDWTFHGTSWNTWMLLQKLFYHILS